MEVTQSNFKEVLPEIELAIKNCTFLTIDCELTGLRTALNSINAFDTPKQYYEKVIQDIREFLVIQYGITLFKFDETSSTFKHQSYNFYVFRRPQNKFVKDQRFLCQTSSIDFLIREQFDFNKLFKQGISYLNSEEEDKCRASLAENQKKRKEYINLNKRNYDHIAVPEENKEFIDDIIKRLENFLESDESEIQLPKCNSFLRRLVYQTNSVKFSDKIELESRVVDTDRIFVASKLKTRQQREDIEQKKYEDLVAQMEDYIGFSKVIQLIVSSEKLIVGHNIILDFLHTIDKFLTPLPDNYEEFKECASSLFRNVIDTKYMSSSEPFTKLVSSTVLALLLDSLSGKPFQMPQYEPEEGKQVYSLNDSKEHEAGYDSFITGLCFMSMFNYLVAQRQDMSSKDMFTVPGLNLLKPYMNKIYLMTLADNQYINFSGSDLNPSRNHVFYINFPKEWTTNNIVQLFSPFGNVHISWISETSAYVGLFKREQAGVALRTLSQSDTYSVTPYARRQAQLVGKRSIVSSPVKRQLCKQPSMVLKKKRKHTDSRDGKEKRSCSPIKEEEGDEGETAGTKAFAESSSWE